MIVFVLQAPVVRKVFFEIVDSSAAAAAAENESQITADPTVAAIPEAISTDPVFQVPLLQLSFRSTNPFPCQGDCKRSRGK